MGKELENVNRDYVYNQECDALVDSNGKGYWMGKEPLDIAKMQEEHDHLASILRREGAEVIYTDAEDYQTPGGENLTKLIFSRDPFIAITWRRCYHENESAYAAWRRKSVSEHSGQNRYADLRNDPWKWNRRRRKCGNDQSRNGCSRNFKSCQRRRR